MPGKNRPPKGPNRRGGKREGAGRPRAANGRGTPLKHIRELAQSHSKDGVLTLAKMMRDESNSPRVQFAAAKAILELGWGKPRKGEVVEREDFLSTPDPPSLSDAGTRRADRRAPTNSSFESATKSDQNGKAVSVGDDKMAANPFTRGSCPGRARPRHRGSFARGHAKRGGRKDGTPNAISARARKAIAAAAKRVPRGTSLNRNHWQWLIEKNPLINEARQRQGQFTLTGAPRVRSRNFNMKAFCQDLSAVAMRAIQTDQFVDRDLVECLTLLGVRDASEFAKFLSIAAPKQSYLAARPHAEEPREASRPPIPEWRLGFDPTRNCYTAVPLDPALTPQDAYHELYGAPFNPTPGWDWKFDNEERRYRAIALRPKTPIPEWTQRFDPKLGAMTPVPVEPKATPAYHREYGSPLLPDHGWTWEFNSMIKRYVPVILDQPRPACEPRFALPPLRRLYRWHPEDGHYSLVRDDDDDWEEYEDNIYIYEYDAERPAFKRVTIVYEYDAYTNQPVRVAK